MKRLSILLGLSLFLALCCTTPTIETPLSVDVRISPTQGILPMKPTVTNYQVTDITANSAKLWGQLVLLPGSPPSGTSVIICWGLTDGGNVLDNWKHRDSLGVQPEGYFSTVIKGLKADVIHYYRCYAVNSNGESWAPSSTSFKTLPKGANPPVIECLPATNITPTTVTLNGNLTSDGGAATSITVYWGLKDGGTSPASWAHSNPLGVQGEGKFSTPIGGLKSDSIHYYRCYASNMGGDAWAESSASFKTLPKEVIIKEPVIQCLPATNITNNSATLNGKLVSNGGDAATTVTIYWGLNDGRNVPGNWVNKVPLGATPEGNFSTTISVGTPGPGPAIVYYRCMANNSVGSAFDSAVPTTSFLIFPPPPAAPSNLKVKNEGNWLSDIFYGKHRVKFTWKDNSTNEREFRIYKVSYTGVLIYYCSIGANATKNEDRFPDAGVRQFLIKAYNSGGESAASNWVRIEVD